MPNTLVHVATQGALSRGVFRGLDPRVVYLGCLLPDVPWILRRAVVGLGIPADPFDLRLYTMAQASLAGTLLLCAAVASLTRLPRLVFACLGTNALLHLLLDATEVKWGNGVHLFAPFSWRMTSFSLVSGEGLAVLVLSVLGALLLGAEILRSSPVVPLDLRPTRLAAAAALLATYLLAPLVVLPAVEASDSYSVHTLRHVASRPGREVWFDRAGFEARPTGGVLEIWTGEEVRAVGDLPDHDASVSLHGVFETTDLVRVDRIAVHRANRDLSSYVALALLALLVAAPAGRRLRRGGPRAPGPGA